jgi:LCP family protein required for cell wall assembly
MTDYKKNTGRKSFASTTRTKQQSSQGKSYLKEAKRKQEAQARAVRRFIGFLFFLIVVVISIFLVGMKTNFCEEHFGKDSAITQFFKNMASSNANKASADFSLAAFGARRKNILLLGVDASEFPDDLWTGTRTDTIILVNIDPRTKSVNALSIPRDSKVYLPDHNGIQKINAAHAIGGVDMTIRTVENTLGVRIDKYIMVHDDAVKNIVKALGGVDVYVEKNMHYNDYAGHLHINLTKGYHHLSPDDAVGYLRFRHDPMGDIGRTQRQQWFLRGVLNELKKPETITKIPDIIDVGRKYIKTNMSLYELSQLAAVAKHIDMDKIEVAMLPGAPNKSGVVSYWILDPEKTQEVVNRLIIRKKPYEDFEKPVTASIVYTDSKSSEAQEIKSSLKSAGIDIVCESRISKTHSQFVAHSNRITNSYFNNLKKENEILSGYQFIYDPAIYMCAESDFTVAAAGK